MRSECHSHWHVNNVCEFSGRQGNALYGEVCDLGLDVCSQNLVDPLGRLRRPFIDMIGETAFHLDNSIDNDAASRIRQRTDVLGHLVFILVGVFEGFGLLKLKIRVFLNTN